MGRVDPQVGLLVRKKTDVEVAVVLAKGKEGKEEANRMNESHPEDVCVNQARWNLCVHVLSSHTPSR